jgi:hypothetical protein
LGSAFSEANIPYAIGGAVALNMWGDPQATRNIEVNVFMTTPEMATMSMFVYGYIVSPILTYIYLVPVLKQLGATTVEEVKDQYNDYVGYYDEMFIDTHFLPEDLSYATVYIGGVRVCIIIMSVFMN